jgi:hypothetical protein
LQVAFGAQPEAEPEAAPESGPEADPESDADADPESDADPELDADPESDPESARVLFAAPASIEQDSSTQAGVRSGTTEPSEPPHPHTIPVSAQTAGALAEPSFMRRPFEGEVSFRSQAQQTRCRRDRGDLPSKPSLTHDTCAVACILVASRAGTLPAGASDRAASLV